MILYIVSSVTLIFLVGFYILYFEPKRRIQKFAKEAQDLGYKVKLMPFQFMKYYLVKYLRQDDRSLRAFKQELKDYDLIVGNMFTKLAILPINTDILKDIYNQLNKLPKNPFYLEVFQLLNGGGIVFTDGEAWKRKRRIISSVFHFEFLNDLIPVIIQISDRQFEKIDQKIKNGQDIDLLVTFSKILSSVVAKCFFGTDTNQYKVQDKQLCEYFMGYLDNLSQYAKSVEHMIFGMHLYRFGLSSRSRQLKKKLTLISGIIRQITMKQLEKIKENKQKEKNLMTNLYQNGLLNIQGQHDPNKYTIDELIGEFFVFFIAGTDTTSNTTNLALHYLSEKTRYVQKIAEELSNLQKNTEMSEVQKLKNMKWTQAVFSQALRINGPSAGLIPRMSCQNLTAGGIKIPKNTSLSLFPIMNQYREEYFQKPQQFLPERWMQNTKIEPYSYMPFGGGQRNCIGQYLARTQNKILFSKIIKKYEFKAKHPIKMQSEFIYSTKHGIFELKFKNKK